MTEDPYALPRRSTHSSRPSWSATKGSRSPSTTSRPRSPNTSTGSTTVASTARSAPSRPSSSRTRTAGTTPSQLPSRRHLRTSTEPGTGHECFHGAVPHPLLYQALARTLFLHHPPNDTPGQGTNDRIYRLRAATLARIFSDPHGHSGQGSANMERRLWDVRAPARGPTRLITAVEWRDDPGWVSAVRLSLLCFGQPPVERLRAYGSAQEVFDQVVTVAAAAGGQHSVAIAVCGSG